MDFREFERLRQEILAESMDIILAYVSAHPHKPFLNMEDLPKDPFYPAPNRITYRVDWS